MASAKDSRIRRISVIAPMFNEEGHIEDLVADVAGQDWSGEVELLVADGRSTDGSVERLRAAAERHGIDLKVLDNPKRWVSHGLNGARSLVPGGFVGSLLVLAPLAIWVPAGMILLDVELAFYVAVALAFTVICLRRLHGLGMLAGWLRAAVAGRAR